MSSVFAGKCVQAKPGSCFFSLVGGGYLCVCRRICSFEPLFYVTVKRIPTWKCSRSHASQLFGKSIYDFCRLFYKESHRIKGNAEKGWDCLDGWKGVLNWSERSHKKRARGLLKKKK